MSSLPINFLCLLQLSPAPLSVSFLGNFYVAISTSSLKKATSLACVTQLMILYFAPFLSFSIPFFPALHCHHMLDPTSAGCMWRSATAHFSGRGELCGQDQRKHHCRHSHVPEHGFLPPVLPSPSSTFQLPKGTWPLIICRQLLFLSLKVDAASLPGQAGLGERLPRQPEWKRVMWTRQKILEREGYLPRTTGSACPSQKIYLWRLSVLGGFDFLLFAFSLFLILKLWGPNHHHLLLLEDSTVF